MGLNSYDKFGHVEQSVKEGQGQQTALSEEKVSWCKVV